MTPTPLSETLLLRQPALISSAGEVTLLPPGGHRLVPREEGDRTTALGTLGPRSA